MSSTSSSIFKSLSMADSCLLSLPSISASKSPSPCLSIPTRPIKLQLSYTLSLRKKTQFPSIVVYALAESEASGESESAGEGSYAEPSEDAKVFVVNLPYDVDSERLAKLFEQAGVVEIAEVIYDRETDRSRGFGFVTMSSVEEAAKAVEKFNRYELDGRPLTVTKAVPRGQSRPRASGFKIYVGNLPWEVDNSALEQIFSEHGKVDDASVVYDRETGRSRGFGFVIMSEESEMNNAIAALNGKSVEGRELRVNVAEQRPRRF